MRLPGAAVRVDVADVVDHQDRGRQQADRDREPERQPVEVLELHVVRAVDGDQPEEQEHEQLAHAGVAVGPGPAGVEDARGDRGGADGDDHPAGDGRQVDPGDDRDAERQPGGVEHAARRDQPGRGDAHGAEAVGGVGAALGVGVVVGEVGADLDEDRADQRGDEGAPAEVGSQRIRTDRRSPHRSLACHQAAEPTSTGAIAAGSVRGRAAMSQIRGLTGACGNFEKSGRRCSL